MQWLTRKTLQISILAALILWSSISMSASKGPSLSSIVKEIQTSLYFDQLQQLYLQSSPDSLDHFITTITVPDDKVIVLAYLAQAERSDLARAQRYYATAEQLVKQVKNPRTKFWVAHYQQYYQQRSGQYALAFKSWQKSVNQAKLADFAAGYDLAQLALARSYFEQKQYPAAFSILYQILPPSPQKNPRFSGLVNVDMGIYYMELGNYGVAKKHLDDAKKIFAALPPLPEQAEILNLKGIIAEAQVKYKEALAYMMASKNKYEQIHDPFNLANLDKNIGRIYALMGNAGQAMVYFEQAQRYYDQHENEHKALFLDQIGETKLWAKEFESAEKFFLQSLEIRKNLNNDSKLLDSYYWLAQNSLKAEAFQKTIDYAESALTLADTLQLIERQETILDFLVQAHIKLAHWDEVALLHIRHLKVKRELRERSRRGANTRYDLQNKLEAHRMALKEAQNSVHHIKDILLTSGLIGTILIISWLFSYIYQRRKRNRALEETIAERTRDIREQATFFNNIVDSVPGVVYRTKVDKAYTPIFISKGSKELFGEEADQLFENGVIGANLYSPQELRQLDHLLEKAISTGELVEMVSTINTPDGKTKWIMDRFKSAYDEKENCIVSDGLILDISDKIQAQESLEEREQELALIYNNTHDQIALLHVKGEKLLITTINDTLKKLWKKAGVDIDLTQFYNKDVVHYLRRLTLNDEAQIKIHLDYIKQAVKTKKNIRYEEVLVPFSNTKMYVYVNLIPILNHEQECEKLLIVIRDNTAIKKAHDAILKTIMDTEDRERSRIARELHDSLGQQLTTASLSFNFLKKGLINFSPEEQTKFLNGMRFLNGAIEESRSIAHNLMPQALEDFGYVLAVESLIEALDQSIQTEVLFYHNLEQGRISLEYELNLYRITQEAINNAIKHSKAKQIIVQLMKYDDLIQLTIEDNGIGFDPKFTTNKEFGLNSMKHRVQALSGVFTLDSSKGRGTIITIELVPLKNEQKI